MTDATRRAWSSIPASLAIGLVLSVVATWIAVIGLSTRSSVTAMWMIELAGRFAGTALATAGCFELAKRLPTARARAATVAAIAFGVMAAVAGWNIVTWLTSRPDTTALAYAHCGIVIVAMVALLAAAGPRGLAVGLPIVVFAAIVAAPVPQVERLLAKLSHSSSLWPAIQTLWAALVLALAARASRSAAEPPEQHAIAVGGLRRATVALWLRLGGTSLAMTMVSLPVPSLQRYVVAAAAVISAFAMIVFATAVVRVASATGTGLPRFSLQIAAFLALWSAVMQSAQAWFDYTMLGHGGTTFGDLFHRGPGMPYVTPIAAATGILILIRAVLAMARAAGDEKLERTAKSTFAGFLFFAGAGALLILAGGNARPGEHAFLATAFGVTFGVGGLVLAASLCSKAASAIEARPGLATATLRTSRDA